MHKKSVLADEKGMLCSIVVGEDHDVRTCITESWIIADTLGQFEAKEKGTAHPGACVTGLNTTIGSCPKSKSANWNEQDITTLNGRKPGRNG